MLDDLILERILGDASDDIVVPADGPGRLMAVRDAAFPAQRRPSVRTGRRQPARGRNRTPSVGAATRGRPVRSAALVVASLALVGIVAGLEAGGGGTHVNGSAQRASNFGARVPSESLNQGGAASAAGTPASPPLPGLQALPGQQSTPNLVPGSAQAKVIKNGTMTLRVTSVESTVDQLGPMAQSAGGFVSSTSMNVPGDAQPASADITLRVPEPAFEAFTSQVEALGKPSQVTISGQDVTSRYADLQARLQALQSTIKQLELIETRAQTIGDTLAVEQQISDQQTQADQIQGQISVLSDETTYGSLSVHLLGPQKKAAVTPPPPSGMSKAWDHARHSFARGVEAVIGALGGIAVFLLFAGIVTAAVAVGWTALRRRLV